MNKVVLSGYIIEIPHITTASNGNKGAIFTLCVKSKGRNANNDYISISVWQDKFRKIDLLSKGDRISICGKIKTYKSSNGIYRYTIVAEEVEYLSKPIQTCTQNDDNIQNNTKLNDDFDLQYDNLDDDII